MSHFDSGIFDLFNRDWGLVMAGDEGHCNGMTISWGGLGTIWGKPVATVYVKPIRKTWSYMEDSEYFTVSFYPESCRRDLGVMGSLSGPEKVAQTGLTLRPLAHGVTFEQAEVTLVCRKIYWNDLDTTHMPAEAVAKYYTTEEPHRMYIGEVIDVIR